MSGDADSRGTRIVWRLVCGACGRESDAGADGWRAYLACGDGPDEEPEVGVSCPDCGDREAEPGGASPF